MRISIRSAAGLLAIGSMAMLLVGCETYNNSGSNGPSPGPSQAQRSVVTGGGRIIGIQDAGGGSGGGGGTSGLGAIGGGVTGALVGASVGHGKMGILTGVAGALGGAMLGNAIERSVSNGGGGGGGGTEYIVERDDGSTITVRQSGDQALQTGDRVVIMDQGGRTRIARDANRPVPDAPATPVGNRG